MVALDQPAPEDAGWAALVRIVGWTAAAALIVGSILLILRSFELLGTPPEPRPDVLDDMLAVLEWERSLLPVDIAAGVVLSVAFVSLAVIGAAMQRLTGGDPRGMLLGVAFIASGVLGAAGQLLLIGALVVGSDPTAYCDCGYLAEEIIGRMQATRLAFSEQEWLTFGAFVAGAAGFGIAATLAERLGWPRRWALLSAAIAAVLPIAIIVHYAVSHIAYVVVTVVATAILIPAWAIWVARRSGEWALGPAGDVEDV